MTNLIKTSTSYSVNNESEGIKAEGTTTVLLSNSILSLYLSFSCGQETIGNVSYNEYDGNSNYNYSIKDSSKKDLITSITDTIINDIKLLTTL